jgi:hypothetical protein
MSTDSGYERPDWPVERRYHLKVSNVDLIHRVGRLEGLETGADALGWILENLAAPYLRERDPDGRTIKPPPPTRRPYYDVPRYELHQEQPEAEGRPGFLSRLRGGVSR